MSQRDFIRSAGVCAMRKLLRKDINNERWRQKKAPLSGRLLDSAVGERLRKLSSDKKQQLVQRAMQEGILQGGSTVDQAAAEREANIRAAASAREQAIKDAAEIAEAVRFRGSAAPVARISSQ